ncbi:MAG: heme exporter protein CcmB [Candidatus Tectimicrobiota bacterium]
MERMSGSRLFVQQILALLAKDLKIEWRTREIFTAMFVFSILVLLVFNFALGTDGDLIRRVVAGVLWIALLFATVLGLQRSGHTESEEDSLQGVLLILYDHSTLFLAKLILHMFYLLLIGGCTVLLCGLWFQVDFSSCLGALGCVLTLAIIGLSTVGTLFSMMAIQTRSREVMLPLLFLPVVVPLSIPTVHIISQLILGKSLTDVADYLTMVIVFDVVFFTLSMLIFGAVIED